LSISFRSSCSNSSIRSSSNSTTNISFVQHFESHGWVLSGQIFEEEKGFSAFKENLMEYYTSRAGRELLTWKKTGGDGYRWYAEITGDIKVNSTLLPQIIKASRGLIGKLEIEKASFLIGGSDIQAPHNDGRGGKNCKGVSVIFAIDDNTYLCIYDRNSIKDIGNGKKSIEYRKVFVPKGRAIFFNSFSCLHGGFKYENGYISSPLCVDGSRHIRIFFRFVDSSTMFDNNDFYLLPDVNEYIEVTN